MSKKTNIKANPTFKNISADGVAECWDNVSIELQGFLWNTIVPLYPTLSQADKEDGITIDMQGNNISDHWKLIPAKFKEELNELASDIDAQNEKWAASEIGLFKTTTPTKEAKTMKTTMTKTVADITPTTGSTISADAMEGHAIAKLIGSREAKGIKAFATDTGTNGMDTRLGNLLIKLSAESALPSGRPSRQQLETNGLYKIKGIGNRNLIAIRSSALWFATNRVEAELFNSDTGNTFSNIHSLQQAMAKAEKDAAKEAAMEADTDSDSDSDAEETETEDSVIGGVDMDAAETIEEIASKTLDKLKANDFQIADLFAAFTKLVAQAETIAVNKLAA